MNGCHDPTDVEWSMIPPAAEQAARRSRVDARHALIGILQIICSGAPWLISRSAPGSTPPATIRLTDCAMATSGMA